MMGYQALADRWPCIEAPGRNLRVTGNYMGVEDREYFLEMDSENSFRWSLDGGATFNDEEIILTSSSADPNYSVAHPLSGGHFGEPANG